MTEDFQTLNRPIARIYNRTNNIIGAGFLVSPRYLLTCAHVIQQALDLQDTTTIPQDWVKLDLPLRHNLSAKVVYWQPHSSPSIGGANRGEDIAVLEVVENESLDLEPVSLCLSRCDIEQEIHLYGFPENHDNGIWAISLSQGYSEFNGWLQMDQIKLSDRIIEGGFSGAPVWDKQRQKVFGMAIVSDLGFQENRTATAFAISSFVLLNTCLKFLHLLDILQSGDQSFEIIKKAYKDCRQRDLEKLIPQTIQEMIKNFADEARFNQSQRSLELDKFVLRLIVDLEAKQSSSFDLLMQWGSKYIKEFDHSLEQERELSKNRVSPSKYQESLTYLMVRFQESKQFKGSYEISATSIPDKRQYNVLENKGSIPLQINPQDKETYTLAEIYKSLPTILEDLLDQNSQYQSVDTPQIIFFLPYALFNETFETITIQDEDELPIPLRVEYRVFFRSEKRLQNKYKHRIKWENNWGKIQSCYQESCCKYFESDVDCEAWEQVFTKLDALEANNIGFIVTKSPSSEIFKVFDRTGLSIAIWAKQILESWHYQQELDDLLKCSIGELPQKIKQKHQEAFQKVPKQPEKYLGHHLTLLWEDPYLLPAHINYSTP